MSLQNQLRGDPLPWLLESGPGPRYLALRDVVGPLTGDPELAAARREAHRAGPIAEILSHMEPEGYWAKPGPGYSPKYTSTVWATIELAQLGASVAEDERIERACRYLLDHALAAGGHFSYNGAPGGTIDCLQGDLCWALVELGCDDPRLATAYDWMARTVTGEGVAPASDRKATDRYYAYQCGPRFACGVNNGLPCAWGAVKVLLALGRWSLEYSYGSKTWAEYGRKRQPNPWVTVRALRALKGELTEGRPCVRPTGRRRRYLDRIDGISGI